ncbi:unnamed protein product [Cuscuta europaea]|uniref:Uncharacterized protein n=1 Tax=Cuscuta europaea TaxID=41803 RepID=A0A9P0YTV8_CUSEU|nr:unnamed protein product [Cuscuta europaea]
MQLHSSVFSSSGTSFALYNLFPPFIFFVSSQHSFLLSIILIRSIYNAEQISFFNLYLYSVTLLEDKDSYEELKSKESNAKSQDLMLKAAGGRKKGGKVTGFAAASIYFFPSVSTYENIPQQSYEDKLLQKRVEQVEKSNNALLDTNKELVQFKESASATIAEMQAIITTMKMAQPLQHDAFMNVIPNMQQGTFMSSVPHNQQSAYINISPQQPHVGSFMSMLMPQPSQVFNNGYNHSNRGEKGCEDVEDDLNQ